MEPTLSPFLAALNPKQRAFVLAYASNGGNGTAAAKAAGYKGTEGSLGAAASRLLRNDKVTRALAELTAPVTNDKILTATQVLERLSEEATDLANFPPNRTKALDLLGRFHGLARDPVQTELLRAAIEEKRLAIEEKRLAIQERNLALEKARLELEKTKGGGVPEVIRLRWVDEPGDAPEDP